MNFDDNPYAAPPPIDESRIPADEPRADARIWRRAGDILLERGAQLPSRCAKCNAAQIAAVVPYRFGYRSFVLSERMEAMTVSLALCARCNGHRRRLKLLGALLLATAVGLSGMNWLFSIPVAYLCALFAAIAGAIAYQRSTSLVTPTDITPTHAQLTGFCPEFVAQFPEAFRPGDG